MLEGSQCAAGRHHRHRRSRRVCAGRWPLCRAPADRAGRQRRRSVSLTPLGLLAPWESSATVASTSTLTAGWCWRRRRALPRWRAGAFWSGFALIYIALHTGFDYYAQHAFFMHRLQHLALHHLGPFLIALGLSDASLPAWRRPTGRRWPDRRLPSGPDRRAVQSAGAVLAHAGPAHARHARLAAVPRDELERAGQRLAVLGAGAGRRRAGTLVARRVRPHRADAGRDPGPDRARRADRLCADRAVSDLPPVRPRLRPPRRAAGPATRRPDLVDPGRDDERGRRAAGGAPGRPAAAASAALPRRRPAGTGRR